MNSQIKIITSEETLSIRHEVMWPDKPLEYVKLPKDREGDHFGLFVNQKMIAVVSFFDEDKEVQFRKLAVLEAYQGKGYGSELLKYIIGEIENRDCNKIWCNARAEKAGFYQAFGLKETDKRFQKGGIDYVVMEKVTKLNVC